MLASINFWTIVWFFVVTAISSAIVRKMKISNWWMIVVIPAVWVGLSIIFGLMKLLIVFLPLLILGAIALHFLMKNQRTPYT